MKNQLKYWWLFLLRGLILVILAIYVFGHPVSALVGVALYIGISLLLTGIFLVGLALSARGVKENWGWQLAEGLIDVLFGIILLSSPGITAAVLPFIVGFWTIVFGAMLFADAFQVKKSGYSDWWINLLGGLLTIFIGYFIINNQLAGAIAITFWIGLGFMIAGIMSIAISIRMKKLTA